MWLCIALFAALCHSLARPFADRLQDTSLWAGKALAPPETSNANPRGVQEALVAGWPSNLIFGATCVWVAAVVFGFLYAWWAGLVAFFAAASLTGIMKAMPIASNRVERYLSVLHAHALQRAANYKTKGDDIRADAALGLADSLEELLKMYMGSGVLVPSSKLAKAAPFGDAEFLLRQSDGANIR